MNPEAFWLVLSTIGTEPNREAGIRNGYGTVRFQEAIEFAKANGLYYPFVTKSLAAGGHLPTLESKPWAAERRKVDALRTSLDILNDVSDDTGLDYAVIKNAQTIEHVPRDIDIFVREDNRDAFLEGLQGHGFEFVYNDGAEISLARPGAMRVDVYSRIRYLGHDFVDESYIFRSLARTSTHGRDHPSLGPEATFLVNSIHGIFGHGALSLLDFLDLRNLRGLADVEGLRERAGGFGWNRIYDLWVRRLAVLETRVYSQRIPVAFPQRLETRFILEAVSRLSGNGFGPRERMALRLNSLWDRILFITETSGLNGALQRSAIASAVANSAGHRLRLMRGDSKRAARMAKRTREDD